MSMPILIEIAILRNRNKNPKGKKKKYNVPSYAAKLDFQHFAVLNLNMAMTLKMVTIKQLLEKCIIYTPCALEIEVTRRHNHTAQRNLL